MMRLLMILAGYLYLYVPIKESVHMLQQNRYQMERYHTWLIQEMKIQRFSVLRQFFYLIWMYGLIVIEQPHHAWNCLLILLCIYAYLCYRRDTKKDYIKKLVFTHRVKRLLIIHSLISLLPMLLLLYWGSFISLLFFMPFLYFLPWLSLYLSACIASPLENCIKESYVKDAKTILEDRDDLIRIGITGSYGKTSVKNMVHAVLSESYYSYMTPHSYNNLMGLTISVRTQLSKLHQVFVAEMGADHVGEIERLAKFIHPSIGIVTAVGPQHLSTFKSQENILSEKMRLIEHLPMHGYAILNVDNAWIRSYKIQHPCHVITYGIHEENADVRAEDITYSKKGTRFTLHYEHQTYPFETMLLGEHNVLNLLAAICVGIVMKVPMHRIQSACKHLRYVEHRLEVKNMGNYTLLDDAYNSNPQGAYYALQVLAQMDGRRILMTPGFLDLGEETTTAHQQYAKQMSTCADEILLICKTATRDIYDALCKLHYPMDHLYVVQTTKDAFQLLQKIVSDGDCVLIENDFPDAFNH